MSKTIALIAHDNCKHDMLTWAQKHRALLAKQQIVATGTTGKLLEDNLGISVTRCLSGPLGGDQQIGARIAEGSIDALFFFWDPLEQQPHDPDIKALLRIAVLWDLPSACNVSTADLLMASPLLTDTYQGTRPDLSAYANRRLPVTE